MLKKVIKVIGILFIISGAVWTLQGVGILPGSIMGNNPQWIVNGIIAIIIGAGIFWFVNRK